MRGITQANTKFALAKLDSSERQVNRYGILAVAMLVDLLFGLQYTWAIFERILINEYGLRAAHTQLVFSSQIVAFGITFAFTGRLVERLRPRGTTIIGALIYGAGLLIAGFGGATVWTLVLGQGVMYGVGLAFGYIGPLVAAVKWFPERKGLATGLVIGAFGSGSFILSAVVKALVAGGMSVFGIFTLFGVVFAAAIILLSFFLVEPATDASQAAGWAPLPEGLLRTPAFWSLVVAFFAGTFGGLSIVGCFEKIGETAGAPEGYLKLGVLVLTLGNTVGRPGWGAITEFLGTRRAMTSMLFLQAAFVVSMIFLGRFGAAYVTLAFLIGFNYGGNFVLSVIDVAKSYGPERVGPVYGLVFLIYIVSGLFGPTASGQSYDRWHSYVPSLALAAAVMAAGAIGFAVLHGERRQSGEQSA